MPTITVSRKLPGPTPTQQALGGPNGVRVPLPDRTLPIYTTDPALQNWSDNDRDLADPIYYSPFAGADKGLTERGGGNAKHQHEFIGGSSDLLPSVAARGIAINQLDQLLRRTESGTDAKQLQGSLSNYARQSDNPYLAAMTSNMLPSVDRDYKIEDVQNRSALTDLLGQAHVLGGNILGSSWANAAYVNQFVNQQKQEKKNKIGAIFGGIPYVGGIIQGGVAFA